MWTLVFLGVPGQIRGRGLVKGLQEGGGGGGGGLEKVCSARSSSLNMWLTQTTSSPQNTNRAHSCSRELGQSEICMSALVGRRNEWQETRKNRNLFQGSKADIGEIFTPVDTNTASCGRSQDTIHPVLFWLACFPELSNEFPAKANIWPSMITCFGAGKRTAFGALANKLEKLMGKACDGGCRETTIYGLKSVNEEV